MFVPPYSPRIAWLEQRHSHSSWSRPTRDVRTSRYTLGVKQSRKFLPCRVGAPPTHKIPRAFAMHRTHVYSNPRVFSQLLIDNNFRVSGRQLPIWTFCGVSTRMSRSTAERRCFRPKGHWYVMGRDKHVVPFGICNVAVSLTK